jgi:hypothetical protein
MGCRRYPWPRPSTAVPGQRGMQARRVVSPPPIGSVWSVVWNMPEALSAPIDSDDDFLSPPQLTDHIAEALQPAVLLIQQLSPPCGAVCGEASGRRVESCAIEAAAHITGHDSDVVIHPGAAGCIDESPG